MKSKEIIKSVIILSTITISIIFLNKIKLGLIYILIALILTLIVNPFKNFLLIKFKLKRTISSLLSISLIISFFSSILLLFVPILKQQGKNLSLLDATGLRDKIISIIIEVVEYYQIKTITVINFFSELNLLNEQNISFLADIFNFMVSQVGNFSIGLLSVLFITYFLLRDGDVILNHFLNLFPNKENKKISSSINKIENLLTRYFSGVLIQLFLIFILYYVMLLILGIENSLAIAFICALLNIIPYLGPLIGFLLMVIFSATNDIEVFIFDEFLINSLWLFIGFSVIQIIDNIVLQPYIFSTSIKSHPLEVFLVIIFSGLLFGIVGLIIAIPLYTTVKVIYNSFFDTKKIIGYLLK